MPLKPWYALSVDEVFRKLRTGKTGLSNAAVFRRRAVEGSNILPDPPRRTWPGVLGRQFKSPLIGILIGASVISIALDDYLDAGVILAAVILNVLVGFIQEFRAERTIEALRRVVTYHAMVIRDGVERFISSVDLVVGDLIRLRAGDRVVADCRVINSNGLQVNEAALTGESIPVTKVTRNLAGDIGIGDRVNMVFSGTVIMSGEGMAVVVSTGLNTEYGQIVSAVRSVREAPTPWQQRLEAFSRSLTVLIVLAAMIIFILGLITGRPVTEMFAVAVAVAVAAIPEGLAIGVTVVLVVGMRRILQKKALTRQLIAVETLGSTTVLCVDKTGTVTEGNMAVARVVTNNHDLTTSPDLLHAHAQDVSPTVSTIRLFRIGLLCNDAHVENEDANLEHRVIVGSPTERALVLAGHAVGLTRTALEKEEPRISSQPFDSDRKYMATLHRGSNGPMLYVKGAPEILFEAATIIDIDGRQQPIDRIKKQELRRRAEQLSREGLRVLALACAALPQGTKAIGENLPPLVFVGFVGIKDPLRPESAAAVKKLQRAGVTVAMITGDHRLTAEAIAKELDLPIGKGRIITGQELAALSDKELQKRIRDISVYARVSASDKIRIVKAWKARDDVVAMTGDGINDAPALKAADIGVALGSGTDVAKEAAKLVLLDDNIKTIASAVEQGRIIFENIRKVTLFLLSDCFSAVFLIAFSLIGGLPLALSAAQILWLNLVTDGLPNIALTVEPKERDVMLEPPRSRSEPLISRSGKTTIILVSFLTGAFTFFIFLLVNSSTGDTILARSVAFLGLGMTTLIYSLSLRHSHRSLLQANPFENRWLILAILAGIGFQALALSFPPLADILGTTPRAWAYWPLILIMIVFVLSFMEALKVLLTPKLVRHINQ